MKHQKTPELSMDFNGQRIRSKDGLICLTDLWKASGEPDGKRDPRRWKRESGKQAVDFISKKLKVAREKIYVTKRGRGGGTWAHGDIFDEYKRYLTMRRPPNLQFKEKNVQRLLAERLRTKYGEDVLREVQTEAGSVDILTPTHIIEVKNAREWKAALGQVLVYSGYFEDKKLRIHLFGNTNKESSAIIIKTCKRFDITVTFEK